jgi:hypothetical protein
MSLVQKAQTQRGCIPEQEVSQRPLAKMEREQMGEKLWLT